MQKFIVEITEENEALIQDPALECYLITSSLDRGFAAGFARRASAAGKLVLAGGGDAPALCRDLGLDGFVLDVSASEKIKADFDRAVKTAGKDKVSGLIVRGRRHEAMLAGELRAGLHHLSGLAGRFGKNSRIGAVVFRAFSDSVGGFLPGGRGGFSLYCRRHCHFK